MGKQSIKFHPQISLVSPLSRFARFLHKKNSLHVMAEQGPKVGDARSLWNFTPSPGILLYTCSFFLSSPTSDIRPQLVSGRGVTVKPGETVEAARRKRRRKRVKKKARKRRRLLKSNQLGRQTWSVRYCNNPPVRRRRRHLGNTTAKAGITSTRRRCSITIRRPSCTFVAERING